MTEPSAQEMIRQILLGIGVKKVVSIDDYYSSADVEYQDVINLFQFAREKQDAAYTPAVPQEVLTAQDNIWTRMLRQFWSKADTIRKNAIIAELSEAFGQQLPTSDMRDLTLLRTFLPEDMLQVLGPEDWQKRRSEILAVAQDDHKVLCLFDQDLRLAGLSGDAGVTLLQQTLTEFGDGRVICGLLTQTIEMDAELATARQFAATIGLGLDQFLPLSKQRLRGNQLEFADGLKMLAMNSAREGLSRRVAELTKSAGDEAHTIMNRIDIGDFEHIVVRSSEAEGVWETDTLFRLFELFRLNSFRKLVLEPTTRSRLLDGIEQLREIRDIKTSDFQTSSPSDRVYDIRKAELFDPEDLLNRSHRPLDLGDIFRVGSNQYFMVLAQPCDLMFRKGSSRLDIITLVQIKTIGDESQAPQELVSFRLDYFEPHPGKRTYVRFRESFKVSTDVLDLAVLNEDGVCRLVLGEVDLARLSVFHEPWRARFRKLEKKYEQVHREFSKIQYANTSSFQKKAFRHLLLCSNKDIDLSYDSSGSFEFGMQRVGRCRAPMSIQILGAYSSFLSRNPQEHDFARKPAQK